MARAPSWVKRDEQPHSVLPTEVMGYAHPKSYGTSPHSSGDC